MERSHAGYYPDPYLQQPTTGNQVYAMQGTGNAMPRAIPAGTTIDYIRTGQEAPETRRRIDYYVQDHPLVTGARPAAGEYYAHGPPAPTGVRPVPAATYYTQDPQAIPGGSKSCGCTPKVEYSYSSASIARDGTAVPLSAVTRQVFPPPASNQPPAAGYYYVQESAPTRGPAIPTSGDTYPLQGRPYPDSGGQQIIGYERYVVPASSVFTYDPTSTGSHDYYRPSLPPPGAQQPSSYRYDADGYPGHVTGNLQQIPHDVAERFAAMRIGGGGGGGGRGANDVIYVPRSSSSDVVYKDSRMLRPRK